MGEQQKHPERTRETELFSLLTASYEFSQKDGALQADLMRVFRYLNPALRVTEAEVQRFVTEGEATRTDYGAQQQPTIAMRMVKMINNERAHKQLESGLASMRLELSHWKDYFGPFMHESADDPFPTPEAACTFIVQLIAQDQHYAKKGRERNGAKVFYDYVVDCIIGDAALPSGNVMFSRQTLPRFRTYVHEKLHAMPHPLFVQVKDALAQLVDTHNESDPTHTHDKQEVLRIVEKVRHLKRK